MIRINCTNCKALLTIDEAFAGGVCRCQHCGTIQTVPSHLKNSAATQGAQSKLAESVASKSLYNRKVKGDGSPGSGLDAIAEVIASSGLSGSGLSQRQIQQQREAYELPPKKNLLMPLLIGAGVLILILAGAVVYLAVRSSSAPSAAPSSPSGPSADAQPAQPDTTTPQATDSAPAYQAPTLHPRSSGAPSFMGVPITESSVVFLLDSGSGTHSTFDAMVQALRQSVESLKPTQKFAIVFWKSDIDVSFPAKGLVSATPQNVAAAEKILEDVYASGASDIKPSLKKAIAANPSVIELATGKWVPTDFPKLVLDARKGSSVKINCFCINQSASSVTLKQLADSTKGQFRDVSQDDLKGFGQ